MRTRMIVVCCVAAIALAMMHGQVSAATLVAQWTFDDLNDSAGDNSVLTTEGTQPAPSSGYADFDGIAGNALNADQGVNNELQITGSSVIWMQFSLDDVGVTNYLATKYAGANKAFQVYTQPGFLRFVNVSTSVNEPWQWVFQENVTWQAGQVYTVAAVLEAGLPGSIHLYLDGTKVSKPHAFRFNDRSAGSGASLRIGSGSDSSNQAGVPANARIYEVRYYDGFMNDQEIAAIPEPATTGVLVLGMLAAFRRRRR